MKLLLTLSLLQALCYPPTSAQFDIGNLVSGLFSGILEPLIDAIVSEPVITRVGEDNFRIEILKIVPNDTIMRVANINGKHLYQLGSEPNSTYQTMTGKPDVKLSVQLDQILARTTNPIPKLEIVNNKLKYGGNMNIITDSPQQNFKASQFQNDIGYILAFEARAQYFQGKMYYVDLRKIADEHRKMSATTFVAKSDREITIKNLIDISVDQYTGSILAAIRSPTKDEDMLVQLQRIDPFALSRMRGGSEPSDAVRFENSQLSKVNRANLKKKLTAALDEVLEKYEDERTDLGRACDDNNAILEDLRKQNEILKLRAKQAEEAAVNVRNQLLNNIFRV